MKRFLLLLLCVICFHGLSAQELVEPPADLELQQYFMTTKAFVYLDGADDWKKTAIDTTVTIGFTAEGDVYLQGLAYFGAPEAWVRGTLTDDGRMVFPQGQYVGHGLYLLGFHANDQRQPTDVVFKVDRSGTVYTIEPGLDVYLSQNTERVPREASNLYEVELRAEQRADIPVVPPADLMAEPYVFETFDAMAGAPLSLDVVVGVSADSLFVQGLCPLLPEAWVAGLFEEDEYGPYIELPRGQFIGRLPDETPLYLLGSSRFYTLNDIFLHYNADTREYSTSHTFVVSTQRDAADMGSTRCYFRRGTFRPCTTGIRQIENGEWKMENEAVYDLQGRKHSSLHSPLSSLPKGVYIQNRKKYVQLVR